MRIRDIAQTTGWRRKALAFAFGICATLTLSPFFVFPLIIPAFAGLFLLVETATPKQAFKDGWWWGWGCYISGLYWFCIALLTDVDKFAWALPFALFGLTAVIAIYPALACYVCAVMFSKIKNTGRGFHIYAFALVWALVEMLRGHILSGFPWNLPGYSFGFSDISLQSASLIGAYGLTFFAVLLGASVAAGKNIFPAMIWGVFAVTLLFGQQRLSDAKAGEATGAVLRIVQANVPEEHDGNPIVRRQMLGAYVQLTNSAGLDKVTHIIWPESSIPYAFSANSTLAKHLGEVIPEGKILLSGALRLEGEGADYDFYNSLVALDHNGDIVGSYDKSRLVPFGEFIPLRFLIPDALKLPVGDKDFSRGPGAVVEQGWAGLPPFTPLICYEAIFPDFMADGAVRPQFLLNVTNDVWFGRSTGPHQHFDMARMRAVEQGIPLVRAANTGISAYIDEYGRIKAQLPLGVAGILDVPLLSATTSTIYREYPLGWLWLTLGFGLVFFIAQARYLKN